MSWRRRWKSIEVEGMMTKKAKQIRQITEYKKREWNNGNASSARVRKYMVWRCSLSHSIVDVFDACNMKYSCRGFSYWYKIWFGIEQWNMSYIYHHNLFQLNHSHTKKARAIPSCHGWGFINWFVNYHRALVVFFTWYFLSILSFFHLCTKLFRHQQKILSIIASNLWSHPNPKKSWQYLATPLVVVLGTAESFTWRSSAFRRCRRCFCCQ